MIAENDELYHDFLAVKDISIIPMMLEVICRTTGMGFAAVARVTEERWLACSVRDEIQFGLGEAGELKIETTICNEIRDSKKEVVIDEVSKNERYCNHHTPAMYGFQSYISFPIFLKNGDFFGTLCAIDPKPARLENPETIGTFKLFAELISFHLQATDLMEVSHRALLKKDRELKFSVTENEKYREISNHHIKEQIRKIRLFSGMLIDNSNEGKKTNLEATAQKVHAFAEELGTMLDYVFDLSDLASQPLALQNTNLEVAASEAMAMLSTEIKNTGMNIQLAHLPSIVADRPQMTQLFYQLLGYILMFSKPGFHPLVKIAAADASTHKEIPAEGFYEQHTDQCEILLEVSNTGIDEYNLKTIFDIFVHRDNGQSLKRYSPGLAYAQKIVHNHGGHLSSKLIAEDVTMLSVVLPAGKAL